MEFAELGRANINGIYKRFLEARKAYNEGNKDALDVKE